jgi:glycyl-tRNA synthetase beta chain
VVREFPELQGIMGNYYAVHDGEATEVAEAIEEHYLPTHSGGALPKTDIGALLSIADKIDNITAFFSIGLVPTGSEDPFALRRQALGIIAVLFAKGYEITLGELVRKALDNLRDAKTPYETKAKILQFFEARIENILLERGYAPDIIQSIISFSTGIRLKDMQARLEAVKEFKETTECNDFLAAIKRVNNITQKAAVYAFREELLEEGPEKKLYETLKSIRADSEKLLTAANYREAIVLFTTLTGPINNFFDNVLVMDKREEIKQNRLSLLNDIWKTASSVADFSRISVN